MSYRFLALIAVGLSICLYTASPAGAQDRPDGPGRSRARETVEMVRRVDRQRSEEARGWTSRRDLPVRIRQRDGGFVQIVGVHGIRPVYVTGFNRPAAIATGTVYLQPGQRLGLSLTGLDMLIGLWDEGHPLLDHQELAGRVSEGDIADPVDHSTHVAGTLIASGVSPEARGMAYQARIVAYDWDSDATEMEKEAERGLLVSNHSYGEIAGWFFGDLEDTGDDQWYWVGDPQLSRTEDAEFGRYGEYATLFDGVASAHPYYLPVVAAGNDQGDDGPATGTYRGLDARGDWQTLDAAAGPPPDGGPNGFDTISGSATAKNVLTVGSIGISGVSNFSSFGPTDDGRIKPDILGFGEGVFSSIASGPDQYARMSGTSMATPNVSGSLLLLQQYYHQLTGTYMTAASLKALVLETARDLDNPGPDYRSGWGLLNAEAAANVITDTRANPLAIQENVLQDGRRYMRTATVVSPGPLRVTLCWTDPPANRSSYTLDDPTPQISNDLDLRVVNERTGDVFYPYTLDPTVPSAPAAPGDNTRDPVEQIFVADAPAGTYTILVTHKGNLQSSIQQPFSIVATGLTDANLPALVRRSESHATVDAVDVQWVTSFERTPGTFRVERVTVTSDGRGNTSFSEPVVVARIAGEGAPDAEQSYSFSDKHLLAGRYIYHVYFESADVSYLATDVDAQVVPPEELAVVSNYPNPFTDQTTLVLDLPYAQDVKLDIYDSLGRIVASLIDEHLAAGRHEIPLDVGHWASGLYFARITADGHVLTHRMVRLN